MSGGRAWRMPLLAAVLAAAAPAAAAGPLDDAMRFTERLYRTLPSADPAAIPYGARLAALIARDRAAAGPGASGVLDWVPLCDCQDFAEHYRLTNLRARTAGSGRVTMFVTVRNGGEQRFRLDLSRHGESWSIEDVHGPRTPSLVARLAAVVPGEEARLRAATTRGTP